MKLTKYIPLALAFGSACQDPSNLEDSGIFFDTAAGYEDSGVLDTELTVPDEATIYEDPNGNWGCYYNEKSESCYGWATDKAKYKFALQ